METGEFGTLGGLRPMLEFFEKQVGLLRPVPHVLRIQEGPVWNVLHPLIFSIGDTGNSVLSLSSCDKLRDTFVLSRVLFETIVNASFILAEGDSSAARALRHAQQKAFRDLDRSIDINGQMLQLKWSGEFDLDRNPDLKAALDEFTSNRGREKPWTPENVRERVNFIDQRYGRDVSGMLQFGLLSIYQHSSEIAHGSLYGAVFALGLTQPNGSPKSIDELKHHFRSNITMLLLILGMCIDAFVQIICQEIGDNTLRDHSRKAIDKLSDLPWRSQDTVAVEGERGP